MAPGPSLSLSRIPSNPCSPLINPKPRPLPFHRRPTAPTSAAARSAHAAARALASSPPPPPILSPTKVTLLSSPLLSPSPKGRGSSGRCAGAVQGWRWWCRSTSPSRRCGCCRTHSSARGAARSSRRDASTTASSSCSSSWPSADALAHSGSRKTAIRY